MKLILSIILLLTYATAHKDLVKGWNLVSIPVSSETAIETLFTDDADGAQIYKYSPLTGWENATLKCSDGCSVLTGNLKVLTPMDAFWFYPIKAYTLTADKTTPLSVDLNSTSSSALTSAQKYSLSFMWHEEKLAYDIYTELYKLYPANQLKNIANNGEIKHIGFVQDLVKKYDLNITNLKDYTVNYSQSELEALAVGKFAVPELQTLYDTLYEKGSKSMQASLEVGCMVEVVDVNDLNKHITDSNGLTDLVDTFTILRNDSYKHYWSFDKGLKNLGITNGCCSLGTTYCKTATEYPNN